MVATTSSNAVGVAFGIAGLALVYVGYLIGRKVEKMVQGRQARPDKK